MQIMGGDMISVTGFTKFQVICVTCGEEGRLGSL